MSAFRTYLPLGRIAWLEGGGADGFAAAVDNAVSCLMAGPKYYTIHSFTRRIRWSYSVDEEEEGIEHIWRLEMEWIHKIGNQKPEGQPEVQNGEDGTLPKVTALQRPHKNLVAQQEADDEETDPVDKIAAAKARAKAKAKALGLERAKARKEKAQAQGKETGRKDKAQVKERLRGLASLKGNAENKAKQMRNNVACLLVQSRSFKDEIDAKLGDFAEKDVTLFTKFYTELEGKLASGSFNDKFLKSTDPVEFKKDMIKLHGAEGFTAKLEAFNVEVDSASLALQDHVKLMRSQLDLRKSAGASSA